MKLEQQVCSLELAKRLKGLGVKQESLFWWVKVKHDGEHFVKMEGTIAYWEAKRLGFDDIYSAFTVAELGDMFEKPEAISLNLLMSGWNIVYCDFKSPFGKTFQDDTMANLMAKMLIYLIENKLQTIKKGK